MRVKRADLHVRIREWSILINNPAKSDRIASPGFADKVITAARMTNLKLAKGHNIPGVPWHLR